MPELKMSLSEPFVSPAWGSSLVVFCSYANKVISEDEVKEYLAKACNYAAKHKVYLVPERFLAMGCESMCIINPSGKVIGAQQQLFKSQETAEEDAIPPRANTAINIASTDFGDVFLAVGDDIFHPEISKIAHNMGAKIIISSSSSLITDNVNQKIIAGVWGSAQENNIYTIGVSNDYYCVCAPRKLTRREDGFALLPQKRQTITAQINLDALESLTMKPFLLRRFYVMHKDDLIGTA